MWRLLGHLGVVTGLHTCDGLLLNQVCATFPLLIERSLTQTRLRRLTGSLVSGSIIGFFVRLRCLDRTEVTFVTGELGR